MSYKVIIDSCGELTEEMKKSGHFETASLQIDVDGHHIVDDESFDQADFLRRVKASGNVRNHHVRHRKDIWKNIIVMRNMYMQ